jgi:serine/threonine protein kinase
MSSPNESTSTKRGPLVPGTVIDGRYRITGLLGQWRIGVAYRATGPQGSLTLLIAPLSRGRAATFRDWARTEIDRTRAARSPSLVTLLDGGLHTEQEGYLVFDAWHGHSLLEEIRLDGSFSNERACRVGEQLGRIAARAHATGLALGDLRPSTVLLSTEKPEVFVLDMGMARGLTEYLASPPTAATAYCSPERALKVPPSPADDVYAIGALLFFLLTERAPAAVKPGESKVATPPSWVKKDEGVARYIDPVVLKAMAPRGVDRSSATELADALGALREVFQLSPAAREVLGLPQDPGPFRHEPTSPFFLHDMLGVPAGAAADANAEPSVDGTIDVNPDPSGEFDALPFTPGARGGSEDDEPPIVAPPRRTR